MIFQKKILGAFGCSTKWLQAFLSNIWPILAHASSQKALKRATLGPAMHVCVYVCVCVCVCAHARMCVLCLNVMDCIQHPCVDK